MSGQNIRVGIVFTSDFRGQQGGGGQPMIKMFLKHAQKRSFDIWLFGMSTTKDEPVGQVSKRVIYGHEYPFVPLFYYDAARYANGKPFVPVRIQAFLAYVLRRRLVDSFNLDILYLHAPQALPFFWFKRQPILYHMHNPQESEATYARYTLARTRAFGHLYSRLIRKILERADELIAIDEESYDRYTRIVPERKERFHFLPGATDTEQFRPLPDFDRHGARAHFGMPPEGKMILFTGRLSWKKGIDLIIRALPLVRREVPDAFLAIAGDGEERVNLEALAREQGVTDCTFFLGHVMHLPSPTLPQLYNCADVLVVSSLEESFALVITEALACGTPVISTPVGVAPVIIRDGVTGFLLGSRDPAELADKITKILRDGQYDRAECVTVAQPYGETPKYTCDVIQQMCEHNGGRPDGDHERVPL